MNNQLVAFALSLAATQLPALTVTIDHASPAAEEDFAYHVKKMGATANMALKVAEHPYAVKSDAEEAFRLKIVGGEAWISGKSEAAVSHGIYALLERMGCDWVMPGEVGEVIPACADPRPADCDIEEAPSFRVRCPWYSGTTLKTHPEKSVAYNLWKTRKKLQTDREKNHPLLMRGGHVWQNIVRRNQAEFDANPEMYALVRQPDGSFKRQGPQVETTHPRVLELFEKYIRDEFQRNKWPNDKVVCLSVGPADGGGFSQSAETQAISSGRVVPVTGNADGTDALVHLCNTLLRRMEGEFPNLHLGFYLYSWHADYPVRYKPDPKVVIVVADISYSRLHSTLEPVPTRRYYRGIMEKWAKTDNVKFFRGYNYNLAEIFLPYSKLKMWADDLPLYHRMNVQGVYNESAMAWATLGPSNYLEAEMLWNVEVDPKAVLSKYCKAAFGAGAPYMEEYFTALTRRQSEAKVETGSFHSFHVVYDKAFVERGLALFAKAAEAATLPVEKERIAHMRFPLEQLGDFLELRQLQFAFRFSEADTLLKRMIAERNAAMDEPDQQWVSWGSVRMLERVFVAPVKESARYSAAPYRRIFELPDELVTTFDPFNQGADMGYADPEVNDAGWLKTKTYSTPWSVQGLSGFVSGSAWYRVRLPEMPEGPVGLLIGGCDNLARVYVNGGYVGEGRGFAKPMAFDLTDFLKPGAGNFLAIQVQRTGNSEIGTGGLLYPSFLFTGPRLETRAPTVDDSIRLLPGGAIEKVEKRDR
jgi:hypothetical protein